MRNVMLKYLTFFLILTNFTLISGQTNPTPPDYWPTDSWRTSTPEEQGLDSEQLLAMLERIQEENAPIDSVLVIRNGYLVLEAYYPPFDATTTHIIHSDTKSIMSTLIGIAIEQGYIEGIDQTLLSFFPDRTIANLETEKKAITLEDVLTMSSGLRCRDSHWYNHQGLAEMIQTLDWPQTVLDLPMEHTPGTYFEYCNGGSHLLSAIIGATTGMSALDYAQANLFAPLGITGIGWPVDPQGNNTGWGEIRMSPRDMAKIGYLFLNGGVWDSEQIVPTDWVTAATRAHIDSDLSDHYGYQWWVDDNGYYMALGYAGQFIYVVPDANMVVVSTANLPEEVYNFSETLLNEYIIPAAGSTTPLPANPEAAAALDAHITALNPLLPVPPLPEAAQSISGQVYTCPTFWNSISLSFQEGEAEAQFSGEWVQDAQVHLTEFAIGLDNRYRFSFVELDGLSIWASGYWENDTTFTATFYMRNDAVFGGNLSPYWLRFGIETAATIQVSMGESENVPENAPSFTCQRQE